jgi:hypothetical protein
MAADAEFVLVARLEDFSAEPRGYTARATVLEVMKGDASEGTVCRVLLAKNLETAGYAEKEARRCSALPARTAILFARRESEGTLRLVPSAEPAEFHDWSNAAISGGRTDSVPSFPIVPDDPLYVRMFAALLAGLPPQSLGEERTLQNQLRHFALDQDLTPMESRLPRLAIEGTSAQRNLVIVLLTHTRHPDRFELLRTHPQSWGVDKWTDLSLLLSLRPKARDLLPLQRAELAGLRVLAAEPGLPNHLVQEAVGAMRSAMEPPAIHEWVPWLASDNKHFRYHAVTGIAAIVNRGCIIIDGSGTPHAIHGDGPCYHPTRFYSSQTVDHTPLSPAAFFEDEAKYLHFWTLWYSRNRQHIPNDMPPESR